MNRFESKMILIVVGVFLVMINSSVCQDSSSCTDFNTSGSFDDWRGIRSTIKRLNDNPTSDGTYYLEAQTDNTNSWIYNESFFSGDLTNYPGTNSICWDYKVFDDGVGGSPSIIPEIWIYFGRTIDEPDDYAIFKAYNITVTENSDWANICAPIVLCNGEALPENEYGQWEMPEGSNCSDWNTLVTGASGIGYKLDILTNFDRTYVGIDNVCYTLNCPEPSTPNFSIEESCSTSGNKVYEIVATATDPSAPNHVWELYNDDGVQVGNTISGQSSVTYAVAFNDYNGKELFVRHSISVSGCYEDSQEIQVSFPAAEPIFHFEDADGNQKSSFCYGEEVYLDGRDSYGESGYHIAAKRRPIGGNYTWFGGPGWIKPTSPVLNVENLSELYAHLTDPPYLQGTNKFFEPGYEYKIYFAIADVPNCVGWRVTSKTFTVECCEDILKADFKFGNINENDGQYTLVAEQFNAFENSSIQHEWYVYSSPNFGEIDRYHGKQTGPSFIFNGAQNGRNYTVIHKIITPCGDVCFGKALCNDCGSAFDSGCELCGPIDCGIIDKFCDDVAPVNLYLDCDNGRYTWEDVSGALGYVVQFTYDGGLTCCNSEYPGQGKTFYVEDNFLPLEMINFQWKCGSWRVRSICQEGIYSEWSAFACLLNCPADIGDARRLNTGDDLSVEIYPNPNYGSMTIEFETQESTNVQVNIYRIDGKLVRTISDQSNMGMLKLDLHSRIQPGIYIFNIQMGGVLINKKVMIQ